MTVLINVVLPVFLVAALAALAQSRLELNVRTLSRAVFYVFGPALVFDGVATSDVSSGEFGQITATLLLITLILWALGAVVAHLLKLEGPTRAAFLAAVLLMNSGNFGLSVTLFAFGEGGLARASVYFALSAALSASLGVYLSAQGQASARVALRRMVGVPLVYAALLGLAFNLFEWGVPEPIMKAIHVLGQASVPVMLTVLGVQLYETVRGRERVPHLPALGAVTLLRLVVAPVLAWLMGSALGLGGLARDVTVLESAMPTAVITTILATEFDSDPPFAALAVLVTTLASLLTLTLWLNWLM